MILARKRNKSEEECIELRRVFAAPRNLIYRLWTEPAWVALWWGESNATNVVRELDVRRGGRWHIDMTTPTGTTYPNGGQFLEVVENEKLVYTDVPYATCPAWEKVPPCPKLCTVEFSGVAEGTLVQLTVRFPSPEDLDRTTMTGFSECLGQGFDRLASLFVDPTSASAADDVGRGRHA
ncbi:MAG: SRPBCC domain-containing protein [Sphingomonas sp.]|uniref:SRPBCC family protein n=1 Tax=Sphingomonas sp. TaxID=28214 RepID=UPI0017A08D8F|nr:SRPBCC domain-containing protein [Sphingomonas sp.]MBA3667483.1 SRPBCC domain-containing protein [Sphingomonas sp.]